MTFLLSVMPAIWPWLVLISAQLMALARRTGIGLSLLVLFISIASVTGLMSPGAIAASLLFGLAHFAGGPALVGFASILGLACGLGYYATRRLWVPVAMHFGFNLTHLFLFTYPGPL